MSIFEWISTGISVHPILSVLLGTFFFGDEMVSFPVELLPSRSEGNVLRGEGPKDHYSAVSEGGRNNAAISYAGKLVASMSPHMWTGVGWREFNKWNKEVCSPPLGESEIRVLWSSAMDMASRDHGGINSLRSKGLIDTAVVDPSTFRIDNMGELMGKETKKFPYLIDRLIPSGAITAITADSGKGKSLFMMIMVKALVVGEPLFDTFAVGGPKKVLIIDQEMDEDLILGRFKAIYESDDRYDLDIMYEQFWKIDNDAHYEWLKGVIEEKGYDVVVLDTLTNIHNASENSSDEMKVINERMLGLTHLGVSVIYLHHNKKRAQGEGFSQHSARGSTEIIAKVASHLLIDAKKEHDEDLNSYLDMEISQEKSRRPESIKKIKVWVRYDEDEGKTSWEYKGDVSDELKAVDKAREFILKIMREEKDSVTVKEVMEYMTEEEKYGKNSIRSGFSKLVKDELVSVSQNGGASGREKVFSLIKSKEISRIYNEFK